MTESTSVSMTPVMEMDVKARNAATTPSKAPLFASARKSARLVDLTVMGSATSLRASHSSFALEEVRLRIDCNLGTLDLLLNLPNAENLWLSHFVCSISCLLMVHLILLFVRVSWIFSSFSKLDYVRDVSILKNSLYTGSNIGLIEVR